MLNVSSKTYDALTLLKPYDISVPRRMVGSERDGAYILACDLPIGSVLSIGIDHNDDFDLAMACAGHAVFMFDHTVDGPPHSHPNFHFHKIGVSGQSDSAQDLMTIESMIEVCSLGNNAVLKIDVEGAEWDVFSTIPAHVLNCFDQILIEIHWLENLRDSKFRWAFCEALRRINSQFTLFHVHGNNNGELSIIDGFTVCNVLELSYVRTSLVRPAPSKTVYPSWPNRANNPGYHDLPLLFYPFYPSDVDQSAIDNMIARVEQDFDSTT